MIPLGFKLAGTRCGLKNKRNDMGLIYSEGPTLSAGVLTTNFVRAACVDYTRAVIDSGKMRALVVNSGNANCCTGPQGIRDTALMAKFAAEVLGLTPEEVAVSSTGVIGHELDMVKVETGIREAGKCLGEDPKPFLEAILTTDLVEKWAFRSLSDPTLYQPGDIVHEPGAGRTYGVAKGSGMIAPNMATMLAYVITDLDCRDLDLRKGLNLAVSKSFNCLTVDGDTSTNDTLLVMSNGASGIKPTQAELDAILEEILVSLAKQVARDGEGATKLVEVCVSGSEDPRKIARTIAESPLVKTAMFGCDPNWGRILMAAGRAGVPFRTEDLVLKLIVKEEEHLLFFKGAPAKFDPSKVSAALKSDFVKILLSVGESAEQATVYTCDLGYGYVRINAEYHT